MFVINKQYTKNDIYQILRVPEKSRKGAWDTGYTRYKGEIYLFANVESAGRTGVNHNNTWDKGDLIWFSKAKASTSQPMIQQMLAPTAKVHVFARNDSRDRFTYYGIGRAIDHKGNEPVRIRWELGHEPIVDPKSAWKRFSKNVRTQDDPAIPRTSIAQNEFIEAIKQINLHGGVMPRGSLFQSEDLETRVVWFTDSLDFDDDRKNIVVVSETVGPWNDVLPAILTEANDDKEWRISLKKARLRSGQNKLKDNLLRVYRGKCCVTGTAVPETLQGCHIDPHSKSGINHSTNGLLMRSDIHDLFDEDLLGIHPDSLIVHIKPTLGGTEYFELDGKIISTRADGLRPDAEALRKRWERFFIFGT
jgi:hypothetical protein